MKLKEMFRLEKKYIIIYIGFFMSLLLYLFIYIAGSLMRLGILGNIVPEVYLTEFVVLLPGPLITDVLIFYLLPIAFYLLFYKIARVMIVGYLKLHKLIYIGRDPSHYGIVEIGSKRSMSTLIRRSLFVGFFSFSLSAVFVQTRLATLFRALEGTMTPEQAMSSGLFLAEAVFLGTFLFTSLSFFIFLPIWFIEDSGIIAYRYFRDKNKPLEIKGIHGIPRNLLEGFISISTVVALFYYIYNAYNQWIGFGNPSDPAILTPLILIILPILVTGLFAIPLIMYEKLLPDSISKLRVNLVEKGVPLIEIPNFENMKK